MKFRITRTSIDYTYESPHPDAYSEVFDLGTHKLKVWFIDIEDIMEFFNTLGEPIVLDKDSIYGIDEVYPSIEIYDYYRE